jgi:oligopeptide/dipeptide ABC transporter ATP-binding protein
MTGDHAPVLEVVDLHVGLGRGRGADAPVVPIVDGVSFTVAPGECRAIVGESGAGKSMTALAIMGLLPRGVRVTGGDVVVVGRSVTGLPEAEYRRLRGKSVAMVFQDPLSSLHPSFRVGAQVAEAIRRHQPAVGRKAAQLRAVELLDLVGIAQPAVRARDYPHQLSGGMRQRVVIAMAIANRPDVLIADEPTSALDVTVQAQVLEVLETVHRETGSALVLISHDLGVVRRLADTVTVFYAGRVVEEGSVLDVLGSPRHPYTRGLLASVPRLDGGAARLAAIPGQMPAPGHLPEGCAFHPRCAHAQPACTEAVPLLRPAPGTNTGHAAACVRADELTAPAPKGAE